MDVIIFVIEMHVESNDSLATTTKNVEKSTATAMMLLLLLLMMMTSWLLWLCMCASIAALVHSKKSNKMKWNEMKHENVCLSSASKTISIVKFDSILIGFSTFWYGNVAAYDYEWKNVKKNTRNETYLMNADGSIRLIGFVCVCVCVHWS